MIIELPFPHKDLMPNRKHGKHWSSTQAVKVNAKDSAYFLTKEQAPNARMVGKTPLRITFVQTDKRHRDLDNLLSSCKGMLDSVAAALQSDDKYFEPITVTRAYGEVAKMIIELG